METGSVVSNQPVQSDCWLTAAANSLPVLIAYLDRDFRYRYANEAYCRWFGVEPQSLIGKHVREVLGEPMFVTVAPHLNQALRGHPVSWEADYEIKPGDVRHVQMEYRPHQVHDEIVGYWAMIWDNMRQHEKETQLYARTEQQSALSRLGFEAVKLRDLHELFDMTTKMLQDVLDLPCVKILRERSDGNFEMVSGAGWEQGLVGNTIIRGGQHSQAGYTLLKPGPVIVTNLNEELRFEDSDVLSAHNIQSGLSVPIPGHQKPWGVLSIHSKKNREFSSDDVHFLQAVSSMLASAIARNRYEKALRNYEKRETLKNVQQQLRRAERLASIGTMAAGIAHEINNPVNSILMTAEYNLRKIKNSDPESPLIEELERIAQDAKRCGEIVHSVLSLSRNQKTAKSSGNISEVVRAAVKLSRQYSQKYQGSIRTRLRSNLPPVQLNRSEIEQVLLNLVHNAFHAGGRNTQVYVATTRSEGGVCIQVRDNGPGIDPDVIPRIFDPFFTTKQNDGGTGLGLSLVHSIIMEHDGSIDVHSELGRGTTFTIELPIAQKGEYVDEQDSDRRKRSELRKGVEDVP